MATLFPCMHKLIGVKDINSTSQHQGVTADMPGWCDGGCIRAQSATNGQVTRGHRVMLPLTKSATETGLLPPLQQPNSHMHRGWRPWLQPQQS